MTTKLTAGTITNEQIEALMVEADHAGDVDQILLCRDALDQNDNEHGEEISTHPDVIAAARQLCADAINNARAQED